MEGVQCFKQKLCSFSNLCVLFLQNLKSKILPLLKAQKVIGVVQTYKDRYKLFKCIVAYPKRIIPSLHYQFIMNFRKDFLACTVPGSTEQLNLKKDKTDSVADCILTCISMTPLSITSVSPLCTFTIQSDICPWMVGLVMRKNNCS